MLLLEGGRERYEGVCYLSDEQPLEGRVEESASRIESHCLACRQIHQIRWYVEERSRYPSSNNNHTFVSRGARRTTNQKKKKSGERDDSHPLTQLTSPEKKRHMFLYSLLPDMRFSPKWAIS